MQQSGATCTSNVREHPLVLHVPTLAEVQQRRNSPACRRCNSQVQQDATEAQQSCLSEVQQTCNKVQQRRNSPACRRCKQSCLCQVQCNSPACRRCNRGATRCNRGATVVLVGGATDVQQGATEAQQSCLSEVQQTCNSRACPNSSGPPQEHCTNRQTKPFNRQKQSP